MNEAVLEAIRRRRVVRSMTGAPVDRADLERVLEAARFAPNAGNRRLQRFVAVQDASTLRVLRMVSPGMLQRPSAAIVVCVDCARAEQLGFAPGSRGLYVDVGTAAATMLLAASAVGLGAGPVTSFSRAAVAEVLNLPPGWSPELIVCLGHPAAEQPPPMGPRRPLAWQELTHWERFPA
jgi:nitroreductase